MKKRHSENVIIDSKCSYPLTHYNWYVNTWGKTESHRVFRLELYFAPCMLLLSERPGLPSPPILSPRERDQGLPGWGSWGVILASQPQEKNDSCKCKHQLLRGIMAPVLMTCFWKLSQNFPLNETFLFQQLFPLLPLRYESASKDLS